MLIIRPKNLILTRYVLAFLKFQFSNLPHISTTSSCFQEPPFRVIVLFDFSQVLSPNNQFARTIVQPFFKFDAAPVCFWPNTSNTTFASMIAHIKNQ